MKEVTIEALRTIIFNEINNSIAIHRYSRKNNEGDNYILPKGDPTDEEIDDFICSNVLFDIDLMQRLTDPGLLGFNTIRARANNEWIYEFEQKVRDWANNNSWLSADLPWNKLDNNILADESSIWIPENSIVRPLWVSASPSFIVIAAELLRSGRLLSEMKWQDFESLIGWLLESDGWQVDITKQTRDGGIDVIATKNDYVLGEMKSLWQAKKYRLSNKVKLSEVRELSAIRDNEKASKAVIVTTSHLSKDAIKWVKRDIYRLDYKEQEDVEMWVKKKVFR